MLKIKLDYYLLHIKAFLISILFFYKDISNKKIVIDNFLGKGYGDNLKYIVEELNKNNLNLKIVWIVRNINEEMPTYIKKVKYGSFLAMYEYYTAKLWIDNVRNNIKPSKRKGQIYLQTWHGPFSSKKIEKLAEKSLSREYIKEAKKDGCEIDAILSNSKMQDNQYIDYFWLSNNVEILKFGFPRNDYLIKNQKNYSLIKKIKKKLKLNDDDYLILYAPTFRDDFTIEGYKLEFKQILKTFEQKTKKKCKLLVRLHPNVYKYSGFIKYNDDIIDITPYPNMQDLSLVCDVIISDYSSTLFDFAIQQKPAFRCALDLEHYMHIRGLVDEYFNYPFPFAKDNNELLEEILEFDYLDYTKKINEFFKENPIYDKGNSTKKIVNWICEKIKVK